MAKREVPEWIGATLDTAIPARVKLRVLDRYDGKCHRTGIKIRIGMKWQMDHIIAIANGGENRESNLAPILDKPHKAKTAIDVKLKAKIERIRKKFLNIAPKKSKPVAMYKGRPIKLKIDRTIVYKDTGEPI